MNKPRLSSKLSPSLGIAARIALIYLLVAGGWIVLSDRLLAWLVPDPVRLTQLQSVKGGFFILVTAGLLAWLVVHYVGRQQRLADSLQEILQGVAATTGDAYFARLVERFARALGFDVVLVGALCPDGAQVETLAAFQDGAIVPNYQYPLAGTPCATVVEQGRTVSYPTGLRQHYPDNPLVAEFALDSYIGTPLLDARQQVIGVLCLMRRTPLKDIDLATSLLEMFAVRATAELERQRSDAERRAQQDRFRQILDLAGDAIIAIDAGQTILLFNQGAEATFGYRAAEVLGQPLELLLPHNSDPGQRELVRLFAAASAATPLVGERREISARRKSGEEFPAEASITTLVLDGQPILTAFLRDITPRRAQELALRRQFQEITTIFDSLNAVVYAADMDSLQLLYLNRYGEEFFGCDWQGRSCYDVLQAGQSELCTFCTNDRLVKDGQPQPPCLWEFQNTRNQRWYQCIDKAVRWPDGRLVRLEIAIDITERKEMERLKDELLSAVSHEMHTPLTAILGYTEYLLDQQLPAAEARGHLQTIHKEAERLNELINNFLHLQRLRARRSHYQFAPLDVLELLSDALQPFRHASPLHQLRLDAADALPTLQGNREDLREVLENLISNAIKYSPAGGEIRVGARQQGAELLLWVEDPGIGIASQDLQRIFERFYRVDSSDRRRAGGTGLGLALVKEIVVRHGGRVWVESQLQRGSSFFVALPLPAPDPAAGGATRSPAD